MGNAQPQQPFTILNDGQLRGLVECGASGREVIAYAYAARYSFRDGGKFNCNAQDAALALGMDARTLAHALGNLAQKTFTDPDGNAVPVLERTARAHRGRNAEYIDRLMLATMGHGSVPNGASIHAPNGEVMGHQFMPNGASIHAPNKITR